MHKMGLEGTRAPITPQCCADDCSNGGVSGHATAATLPSDAASAVFLIQKMDCPTEERLIRDRLEGMAGVETLSFNLLQRELTIAHRLPSIAPLVSVLTALDMEPAVKSDSLGSVSGPTDR